MSASPTPVASQATPAQSNTNRIGANVDPTRRLRVVRRMLRECSTLTIDGRVKLSQLNL